jgi:hypothetical protein
MEVYAGVDVLILIFLTSALVGVFSFTPWASLHLGKQPPVSIV